MISCIHLDEQAVRGPCSRGNAGMAELIPGRHYLQLREEHAMPLITIPCFRDGVAGDWSTVLTPAA